MSHVRTQILDAFVAELTSLLLFQTVSKARVLPLRADSVESNVPAALIYVDSETRDGEKTGVEVGACYSDRILNVRVDVIADTRDSDVLDDYAVSVEPAILTSATLDGLVSYISLLNTSFGFDERGSNVYMSMSIVFEIEYSTTRENPELPVF